MATDPGEIVEAAVRAMTPRTRLFFFSHVLSPTGLVLPAKELCAEARRRGILTVVDGAHAPAMIPLNVDDVGADFYAANLHKWLLAPTGTGFLVIGPGNEDRLQPLHVSWGYHADKYPLGEHGRSAAGRTPATPSARRRGSGSWSSRGRATSARGWRCRRRSTSRRSWAGTRVRGPDRGAGGVHAPRDR